MGPVAGGRIVGSDEDLSELLHLERVAALLCLGNACRQLDDDDNELQLIDVDVSCQKCGPGGWGPHNVEPVF